MGVNNFRVIVTHVLLTIILKYRSHTLIKKCDNTRHSTGLVFAHSIYEVTTKRSSSSGKR